MFLNKILKLGKSGGTAAQQTAEPSRSIFVDDGLWRPPPIKRPDEDEGNQTSDLVDLGKINTNAKLYLLPEQVGDQKKNHSLLHMPSSVPEQLLSRKGINDATLNILMADVSGSMGQHWDPLMRGWNEHVAPFLVGRTEIYVFSTRVVHIRSGTTLKMSDFLDGGTDLTGALQTIVEQVYQCKEKYVNIFIITDGDHNRSPITPESVIDEMYSEPYKMFSVYLLGAGYRFPVDYSIKIRSRLHNGSANLPSLFWAKQIDDVMKEMVDIGRNISNATSEKIELSTPGLTLPGSTASKSFYTNEWVYFPEAPEKLTELHFMFRGLKGQVSLSPEHLHMQLLAEVFRQWNGVIIQKHNSRERIPPDLLSFMDRLLTTAVHADSEQAFQTSIAGRLSKSGSKTIEVELRTSLNKIKTILTSDEYHDQVQLAEDILSTTVSGRKYEVRSLQLKGHTDKDYEKDCKKFKQACEENKEAINAIVVTPEECCRITMTSTVSDIQDQDFFMMLDLNKYEFLKQFTISGIPVFAPTRDSVILNPWSVSIRGMLRSPYTIMSQVAMESFAAGGNIGTYHKDVKLKHDDDNTHFNAVIPVFSPEAAKVMEPIVCTRIYAMCVTFAILKNPHIIDFNVHMAALACTWVRILFEHPSVPRPEYVNLRVASINATAEIYMKRPSYIRYCKVLKEDTPQALMTESTKKFDDHSLKCESLIKPMFMLHMMSRNEELDEAVTEFIVKTILVEYIGRCLSHYKDEKESATTYTDFFVEAFADQEKKKEWMQSYIRNSKASITESKTLLLSEFYTMEMATKAATKAAKEEVKSLQEKLKADLPLKVNMEKVKRLRSVSAAGDVSWPTLMTFTKDLGLKTEVVEELFSEKSVFVYTAHALKYRSSRERLSNTVNDYNAALTFVIANVQKENMAILVKEFQKELVNLLVSSWLNAYHAAHAEVVKPMTKTQIITAALQQGVEVTNDTFDQVYRKYRPHLGLLSNACQAEACPFYLQPNKRYNQHAIVERKKAEGFPHAFHQVAYKSRHENLDSSVMEVLGGTQRKRKGVGQSVPLEAISEITHGMEKLKALYSDNCG